MDGTKLGRVIDQLKGIMIKSPDSSGSTTTPDSKGESFEVLSSDDEKEVEPTTSKKPSTSLEARGGSTVGEYISNVKKQSILRNRRMIRWISRRIPMSCQSPFLEVNWKFVTLLSEYFLLQL